MARKHPRFHGLKRLKVRQTWNKYNLYNLSRLKTPSASSMTFFQQKWAAKSMTRAYHGEQVREKQWTRMFDRRIPAVVEMDHQYLAKTDGSEMAAGRGSGEDDRGQEGALKKQTPMTPYMHMVYHPTERRLDTAIFRALFASSARQARQFVVHGHVKVNGKKMNYPGYMLNPGDMFAVEPERVLFAAGAPKGTSADSQDDQNQRVVEEEEDDEVEEKEHDEDEEEAVAVAASDDGFDAELKAADAELEAEEKNTSDDAAAEALKKRVMATIKEIKTIIEKDKKEISGKRLRDLRAVHTDARKALSKMGSQTPASVEAFEQALAATKTKIAEAKGIPAAPEEAAGEAQLSSSDQKKLDAALERIKENPVDETKSYATPWRPRDYMSAFAFIPRYLEVNQNICAAVYLRHPVVRQGTAEVPTPFHLETNTLAFNWYLRRR